MSRRKFVSWNALPRSRAWGVAAVLILAGWGVGLEKYMKEGMNAIGEDIIFVFPGHTSMGVGGYRAGRPISIYPEDVIDSYNTEIFKRDRDLITRLKQEDAHFARIAEEYHELNREVHRHETEAEPLSELAVAGGHSRAALHRFAAADALIVGSGLKRGGLWSNPLDPARVEALARAFAKLPEPE